MGRKKLILGLVAILLISGCGPKRPLQEFVDAKIAIQKAKEAGAGEYAPKRLGSAQDYLTRALGVKRKREAKELAREAEMDARIAESMAKRIEKQEKKNQEEALKAKSRTRQEAKNAIAEAQEAIERAEKENKEIKIAQEKLQDAREALKEEQFKVAMGVAQGARELALKAGTRLAEHYKVKKGETLKIIAKKVYGDPEEWIIIYRANKNKIKNANIIHPGQVLRIPRKKQ